MPVLQIRYGDELLIATGLSQEELDPELRFLLATKLYELGRLSAGQAGKLARMSRLLFLGELARRGFTVLYLDQDAIEDDLAL